MRMVMRWAVVAASAAFVLALPTFLISSNVRWAANNLRMYAFLFDRHQVTETAALPRQELLSVSRQIVGYFNSPEEPLHVVARVGGAERGLFTPREVQHMADVKRLFRGVYRVRDTSGALLLLGVALALVAYQRRGVDIAARLALIGGLLTVALVLMLGLGAVVSFGPLFYLFHVVSFGNDLWQLQPTDYLGRIFPQGFWQDATLLIGAATVVEAVAMVGVAYAARRWAGKGASAPRKSGPTGHRRVIRRRSQGRKGGSRRPSTAR